MTADTLLQISDVTSRLKRLQQGLDEQNAAMQQQNKLISRSEAEIVKNNALVERKQTQVDQLNKKIDFATSKLGGVRIILCNGAVSAMIDGGTMKPSTRDTKITYL